MRKTVIYGLLIFFISIFQVSAQESVPVGPYPGFDCISFTTTCGRPAAACGFSEEERIQAAIDLEKHFCGIP